jgi:hypothetical protein
MSPTYFAVRQAALDKALKTARRSGDLTRMQQLLGEKTSLHRAMYGTLA